MDIALADFLGKKNINVCVKNLKSKLQTPTMKGFAIVIFIIKAKIKKERKNYVRSRFNQI